MGLAGFQSPVWEVWEGEGAAEGRQALNSSVGFQEGIAKLH